MNRLEPNAVRPEWSLSLAVRLVLVLLVPITLCLAIYGYGNVRLRHAEMVEEARREVRGHGVALGVALDAILRDRRLADLHEITEDLSRADRVLGVLVFNRDHRLVQSSRRVVADQALFAPLARRAWQERRPLPETRRAGERTLYAYAFPIGGQSAPTPRGAAVLIRDLRYIDDNLQRSTRSIALLGLVLALGVAVGTWVALRSTVLRPVASLVEAAERVGAGSLDEAVPAERRDEVGRLARAFNRMVASLRTTRRALDDQNEATLALERRLRHAQRLALVGQMAANVAHQVGSPLNVVMGRARYALRQGVADERERRHFQEILAGAEQISRVIEQLLSQARKARGASGPVDLHELAHNTLRFLEVECERLGVQAAFRGVDSLIVQGSRDELEQVLLNLCVNALQAQPRGGVLEITLARAVPKEGSEMAEITVDDAGPGVPLELREQVFEPFFTTKAQGEGTGLGLAICNELVQRLGGTVRVESSPQGGARFRVELPLPIHTERTHA